MVLVCIPAVFFLSSKYVFPLSPVGNIYNYMCRCLSQMQSRHRKGGVVPRYRKQGEGKSLQHRRNITERSELGRDVAGEQLQIVTGLYYLHACCMLTIATLTQYSLFTPPQIALYIIYYYLKEEGIEKCCR